MTTRSAVEAASKAQLLLGRPQSFFEFAEYPFYSAMAHAAFHAFASADQKAQHLAAVAAHYKQIEVWAAELPREFWKLCSTGRRARSRALKVAN